MEENFPATNFFRYSVAIPKKPGNLKITGDPRKWPSKSRLPRLCEIESLDGYGDVYAMWDPSGLYFGTFVGAKKSVIGNRRNPVGGDCMILWIDTRDVHNVHRATRFCHEFIAIPRNGTKGPSTAWQVGIQRAREKTPICKEDQLKTAAKITKTTYGLTLAIPAAALNGYDPREFPRLGFTYILFDRDHRTQTWASPYHMPFNTDPSLWGTLELQGA